MLKFVIRWAAYWIIALCILFVFLAMFTYVAYGISPFGQTFKIILGLAAVIGFICAVTRRVVFE